MPPKEKLIEILVCNHECQNFDDYDSCERYLAGRIDDHCLVCLKEQIRERKKQLKELAKCLKK